MTKKTALDLLAERVRHLETLEEIMSNIHGWDGSAWRKLPMLWGYSDRWMEYVTGTAAGAGDAICNTVAVDPGFVHVLQCGAAKHDAGVNKQVEVYLQTAADYVPILVNLTATTDVWYPFAVNGVLKATDRVAAVVVAPGDGKKILLRVWGYKMLVSE